MDYSWRPPPPQPPIPGNICPICSVPHFPFCPPPPPFPQNPRFQFPSHPDQFYPRPPPPAHLHPHPQAPYDPFTDHHREAAMYPHRQFDDPPRPWKPNHTLDRDPYSHVNPNFEYSHPGAKRLRVDESALASIPHGPYGNENYPNPSRALFEDERRLKLIRDHGGVTGQFGGFQEGRDDINDFLDQGPGNFVGKGGFYNRSNFSPQKYKEDLVGHSQHTRTDRNVEVRGPGYNRVQADARQENGHVHGGGRVDSYRDVDQVHNGHEERGNNLNMEESYLSRTSLSYHDQRTTLTMESKEFKNQLLPMHTARHHSVEAKPIHAGNLENPAMRNAGPSPASRLFGQPPLPASPPPMHTTELPRRFLQESALSSSPSGTTSSLFPMSAGSLAPVPSLYPPAMEPTSATFYSDKTQLHASTGFAKENFQTIHSLLAKTYTESEQLPLRHIPSERPKVVDASHIFKHPHRAARPDHIVIILRGLPGSGKSYLAKMLRDLEVENGGSAPRIHAMDDYFMTEVEKVEESEVTKSSGSVRGKKPVMRKVMEYCYEPEMEEAYRSSMLKAFKKTLDDGVFSFIIVDDRNLRVADFAQFWATAKRSGYEVYLLEATYRDPVGCAARNVHGFTQDDIEKMANKWEEAPPMYMRLNIKTLLHGDALEESGIQEVDMDTEDGDITVDLSGSEERNAERVVISPTGNSESNGPSTDDKKWDAELEHSAEEVKELEKSKWSKVNDEDDAHNTHGTKGKLNALSGLIQSYSKEGKSVRWSDQVANMGFSIGAVKNANVLSLVIGPGSGYNLKSNPLPEEEKLTSSRKSAELKRQNVFQERLRAERESFKAVFDKRRQRIGGFDIDEE